MSCARILGATVVIVALAGCPGGGPPPAAPGVEVSGKVLLASGSPLTGGTLVLRPVNGIHGASAKVQKDGTFTLIDPAGKNAVVPGQYQVYVRFSDPADKALRASVNKVYQDTEDGDSDVVVDIQSKIDNLVIRLKR